MPDHASLRGKGKSPIGPVVVAFGLLTVLPIVARGEILPEQVLVVFNSQASGATALKDAYLAAHPTIPSANVLDLNTSVLVSYPADITYAQFTANIRDPIRNYLLSSSGPTPEGIVCILMIHPMPHRIFDMNDRYVGDGTYAPSQFVNGRSTYAAIDSELTLLWHDLDAGEAGETMDSMADNMIVNPYHKSALPISAFSRANIQMPKTFTNLYNVAWDIGGEGATQLTPGDMYLVCRLDGTTLADAEALIDRAKDLHINKAVVWSLFDEWDVSHNQQMDDDFVFYPNDVFDAGNDYEETSALLSAAGWNVRYDGTTDFVDGTELPYPLISLATYGVNHHYLGEWPPLVTQYMYGYKYAPGAIFNSMESDNGRGFNTLVSIYGLGQLSDFITAGGTFGIGNVWEPLSFTMPDNEFLIVNFLTNGLTWAESAYTSIPALSWQQMVVGDPLAKPIILNDPGLPKGDLNGDGLVNGLDIDLMIHLVTDGPAACYAAYPTLDPIARGDFTGDYKVTLEDLPGFLDALLAQ